MAGVAGSGEPNKLSAGRALMAGFASERGMGPNQRKAVLVLLYVLDRNLPAFHRVASFALRSHLSAMDVGMAVRAFLPDIGKYKFYVALCARDFGMHSAQRVRSLAVIEIWYGTDRLPAHAGMAALAGNIERAVGTARGGAVLRRLLPGKCQRRHKQNSQDPYLLHTHTAPLTKRR